MLKRSDSEEKDTKIRSRKVFQPEKHAMIKSRRNEVIFSRWIVNLTLDSSKSLPIFTFSLNFTVCKETIRMVLHADPKIVPFRMYKSSNLTALHKSECLEFAKLLLRSSILAFFK